MELLVILLGEFLFFPFTAFALAVIDGLLVLTGAIIEFLIFFRIYKKNRGKEVEQIVKAHKKACPFPFRLVLAISQYGFLIFVFLIIIINLFFFEPTMRSIAAQIAQKKGMEISFTAAQGNLFSGTLELEGLTVKSTKGTKTDFDLKADSVALDIDVFSLLSQSIVVESLRVDGVAGDIRLKAKDKAGLPSSAQQQGSDPLKPRKAFVIRDLSIKTLNLKLYHNGEEPLDLVLDVLESKPFRSEYAIFDTFFRSNISGTVEGQKISIASREVPEGRETEWNLEAFPVAAIGAFTDKAPLNWFTDGTLTAQVKDRWQDGDHPSIAMDWSLQFKDAHVEAPAGASLLSKSVTLPIVKYINGKTEPLDLQFSLTLNERQFESASSLDAAGLWDATVAGLLESLSVKAGQKKSAIQQGMKNKIDGLKDFLKKDEPEPDEEGETKAPE